MCNKEKELDRQLANGKITRAHHYAAIAKLRGK